MDEGGQQLTVMGPDGSYISLRIIQVDSEEQHPAPEGAVQALSATDASLNQSITVTPITVEATPPNAPTTQNADTATSMLASFSSGCSIIF